MKQEVMVKWVGALRDPKYKQGKEFLRKGGAFCCLGVLCDISGVAEWDSFGAGYAAYNGSTAVLPGSVQRWAGIKTDVGYLDASLEGKGSDGKSYLAALNDDYNYSFEQLADVIEKNWETM